MSTGTTCTVYVDGERLPDGSPGDDESAPTGLSGLTVTWGRETTVDQPEPSTCTLSIMDAPGGPSYPSQLRTGVPLYVTASGTTYPDPTVSTFADPDFADDPPAYESSTADASSSSRRVPDDATTALQILPRDASRQMSVVLPPAPYAAPGTQPERWDQIPTTKAGQVWSAGATVWAPAGAVVTVSPVLFSGPYAGAWFRTDLHVTITGDDDWHTVAGDFDPEFDGAWVGLQVTTYPTGPRWVDLDEALAWVDLDPAWTWQDYGATFVTHAQVLAPTEGTERTVLVFAGRISDLEVAWDEAVGTPVVQVAAVDFTADLDNRDVGDEPWLVEAMHTRFERIIDLSGLPITSIIADSVAGTLLSWQDVDNQPAAQLLRDLATSVDAVMWSAVHQVTGAYLRVEDPATRAALYQLALVDGLVEIVATGDVDDVATLSACDVLRDPAAWGQTVSDVSTRVAVTWLEQTLDDEGLPAPTERTVIVVDDALEARLGTRRMGVETLLQSDTDARDVADRLLARTSSTDWRVSGITVDDALPGVELEVLLDLLDGTARIGMPLRLTDLPDWAPTPGDCLAYLEGSTLTFEDGRWIVAALLSSAPGLGQSATWADLDPTWRWVDFDPAISWAALRGVAGPQEATA